MADKREVPNRDLLEHIAGDFRQNRDVVMATMFRSPGLRTGGKVFAFLGHEGELIVKLPADRARDLVRTGTAEDVTMGKRTMREWIAFPAQEDRAATLVLWQNVAHEAHDYVESLRRSG